MKCCTQCGVDKPEAAFEFRDKETGSRRAQCRKCRGMNDKRYRRRLNSFADVVVPIDPKTITAAFMAFMLASARHQVAGGNPPPSVNMWPAMN